MSRIFVVWFLMLCVVGSFPAWAGPGDRIRVRSVQEAHTVSRVGRLPASLLVPRQGPAASPPDGSMTAEVFPGLTVPVAGHDFGLGSGHPARVSQRMAFRVGAEANQATWALSFLPHQPELRTSLVALFGRLSEDTNEFEESEGFSQLADAALAGESPAVLLGRHRELMDALSSHLSALGGERRWYFDLGYSSQHLRMVLFFQRSGMVSQGLAAVRVLAAEVPESDLEPDLKAIMDRLMVLDARQPGEIKGEVERLLARF